MVPEVDFTYFFADHWAAELIAATTQHSVHQTTAGDIGSVWLLPPTLTVQYHFNPEGKFRPYVGAGMNYTFFYSPRSPLPNIHYSDSFGWRCRPAWTSPSATNGYFFNADVKKLFLSTDVSGARRRGAGQGRRSEPVDHRPRRRIPVLSVSGRADSSAPLYRGCRSA